MASNRTTVLAVITSISLLISCLISASAVAAFFSSESRLIAGDLQTGDSFGYAVDISGDTAVVSANGGGGNAVGAVYVFERTATGWERVAKLMASDGAAGDSFGISVAISGDTVAVGVPLDDNEKGSDAGSVYLFVKPANGWSDMTSEAIRLIDNDNGGAKYGFGTDVALEGNLLVVGAPGRENTVSPGKVYVYEGAGDTWSRTATLTASDGNGGDVFGYSLDISGSTVVVGAYGNDSFKGAAYVFEKPATGWGGNMTQEAKLVAPDAAVNDFFGGSVAIDGDTIVIGANGADAQGEESGSAYVSTRSATKWREPEKLTPMNGIVNGNFGYAVDIGRERIVIGASHHKKDVTERVYVFSLIGANWTELGMLSDRDGNPDSNFGSAVAVDKSGMTVIVGANNANANGISRSGAAYVLGQSESVDLVLVMQDAPDPVKTGDIVTYTLMVTNVGGTDATSVVVEDTLPQGMSYVSDDSDCTQSGQGLRCELGTIGKDGVRATIEIKVRADRAGKMVNTASVTANETDADDSSNTDSEETSVSETDSNSGQSGSGGGGGVLNPWLLLIIASVYQIFFSRKRWFAGWR